MGLFDRWTTGSGKLSFPSTMWSRRWRGLVNVDTEFDYARNDYDLFRSLYYSASFNGKGKDMLLASMLSKKIVNTAAGFALNGNITVGLGEVRRKDEVERDLNQWLDTNHSLLLEYVLYGMRDGDSYLYVDEFGNLEQLDAKNVEVVLEPMTGLVAGYDITESYTERDGEGTEKKWTVIKEYRFNSVRYTRYPAESVDKRAGGQVIYYKVYTNDGAITPTEKQTFYVEELVDRPLPVIHFANDREPRAVYGNSELLNCIVGFRQYHAVIENATKGVINSSHPVPYISGAKSPEDMAKKSNKYEDDGMDEDKVDWRPESILFFRNPETKVGYVQANSFMDDVGKLLEYYFYLVVEASETPEFVFGTAVSSSKASVSEQMPIVVQKAERKRAQLKRVFQELIKSYIDRQVRMSNPLYLPLKNVDTEIHVTFPDLVDEDKRFTLDTVKFLVENSLISDETALSLLMASKIDDAGKELEKAKEESAENAKRFGLTPEEPNRLKTEAESVEDEEIEEIYDDDRDVVAEYNYWRDSRGRFAKKGAVSGARILASDGTLRTEAQVTKEVKAYQSQLAKEDKWYQDNLSELADSLGTKALHGPVKKVERIKEKTIEDYRGNVYECRDVVRGTLQLKNPKDLNAYVTATKKKFKVVGEKSTMNSEGYRDHKIYVELPKSKGVAEMIVATPPMLYAKLESKFGGLGGHDLYNLSRNKNMPQPIRKTADKKMDSLYSWANKEAVVNAGATKTKVMEDYVAEKYTPSL